MIRRETTLNSPEWKLPWKYVYNLYCNLQTSQTFIGLLLFPWLRRNFTRLFRIVEIFLA